MASTSINLGTHGLYTSGHNNAVLIAQPDTRFLKYLFLVPALLLLGGIVFYRLPLGIDRDFQLAGSVFIIGSGLVGIISLLALYEGLSTAVYTLTNEHIEEQYGIFYKRLRSIPLSYVRDVTLDQNSLQAVFGVSSITVSPTNGNKIVLSNIRDGKAIQEIIWKLVLSESPGA